MALLNRVRVTWTGSAVVGGGVSTFHFLDAATGYPAALSAFFTQVAGVLPAAVVITVPSTGEKIDVATGQPAGLWSESGGSAVVGAGASNHAAGVGARVTWQTLGYNNGRRVKGSTFLVPLVASVYGADGTIENAPLGALNTAAAALVSAMSDDFVVYTRKKGILAGQTAVVTAGTIPDKVSTLRSRRT